MGSINSFMLVSMRRIVSAVQSIQENAIQVANAIQAVNSEGMYYYDNKL